MVSKVMLLVGLHCALISNFSTSYAIAIEGASFAVHTGHQGMCVWLRTWAPVHMCRCKSPCHSFLSPWAMILCMA